MKNSLYTALVMLMVFTLSCLLYTVIFWDMMGASHIFRSHTTVLETRSSAIPTTAVPTTKATGSCQHTGDCDPAKNSTSIRKAVPKPKVYEKVKGQCNTSQGNVVFVKTHKTGSTTLTTILNRFGYHRNLSFVQMADAKTGHFNYHTPSFSRINELFPPIGVTKNDTGNYTGYNISAVHFRYSRAFMEALMGDGVTPVYYITILREPVSQFVSAFRYFDVAKALLPANSTSHGDIEATILEVLNLSQSVFVASPFAWNNQLFDLGMRKPDMLNESSVRRHVELLEREIDLVLITEHFDESLVLLKKLLCWEYDDILYLKRRMQPLEDSSISSTTTDRIRKHNHADSIMYDFFNRTLWKKVSDYGPSFEEDLGTFRNLLSKRLENCTAGTEVVKVARGQENVIHVLAKDASDICWSVVRMYDVIDIIRRRQGG